LLSTSTLKPVAAAAAVVSLAGFDDDDDDCDCHVQDVDMAELARLTDGFSGADIAELCRRAVQLAISEAIEFLVKFTFVIAAVPGDPSRLLV